MAPKPGSSPSRQCIFQPIELSISFPLCITKNLWPWKTLWVHMPGSMYFSASLVVTASLAGLRWDWSRLSWSLVRVEEGVSGANGVSSLNTGQPIITVLRYEVWIHFFSAVTSLQNG